MGLDVDGGSASPPLLPPLGGGASPGLRTARPGFGGGGMRALSVSILGTDEEARCALFKAGNAGATSSSVSVAEPSLSSSSGGTTVGVARVGSEAGAGAEENQLLRYEVIVLYVEEDG